MYEVLCFDDITPIQILVKIGKEDYILNEASGEVAAKYRNAMSRSVRMSGATVVGMDGLGDIEPMLVSLCLFKKEGNTPVTIDWVKSLPARVVTPLFNKIKEISLLDEKESEVDLKRKLADTQRKLALIENGEDALKKPASSTGNG